MASSNNGDRTGARRVHPESMVHLDDLPVRPWWSREALEKQVVGALYKVEGHHHHLVPTEFKNGYEWNASPAPRPQAVPSILYHLPVFRKALAELSGNQQAALEKVLIDASKAVTVGDPLTLFGLTPESLPLTPDERASLARTRRGIPNEWSYMDVSIRADRQLYREMAARLCQWAPDEGPVILPSVDDVVTALMPIVRKGLPLSLSGNPSKDLLDMLPTMRDDFLAGQIAAPLAQLEAYLRQQLDVFEVDEWRDSAKVLFAHAPGMKGTTAGRRYEAIATILEVTPGHAGKFVRPKIIRAFAEQLYRAKFGPNYC